MDYYTANTIELAFVGDAVYEQFIRTYLVEHNTVPSGAANLLHKEAVKYVRAGAQAENLKSLINDERLTDKELALVKRARNHKTATKPRNADVKEYKLATAFEALLGYLYLSGQSERLLEIMEMTL